MSRSHLVSLCFWIILKSCDADAECSWPGLDLSNLYNLGEFIECNFTTDGIEEYGLLYSVCKNSPLSTYESLCNSVTNKPAMVIQTHVDGNDCADIAYWESDNEPIHNKTNNSEMWTFKYSNGQKTGWACYEIGRFIDINFICDPNAVPYDPLNVDCGEDDRCYYHLNIKTSDACSDELNHCFWDYTDIENGETYSLNLTDVKGAIISGVDENGEYLYAYTPCINALTCNHQNEQSEENRNWMKQLLNNNINNTLTADLQVMAFRANISSLDCMQYLAIWQNGINQPNYDKDNKVWEFVYIVDANCNGLPSLLIVYWRCNLDAGQYKLINCTENSQCVYEMTIESQLACFPN